MKRRPLVFLIPHSHFKDPEAITTEEVLTSSVTAGIV